MSAYTASRLIRYLEVKVVQTPRLRFVGVLAHRGDDVTGTDIDGHLLGVADVHLNVGGGNTRLQRDSGEAVSDDCIVCIDLDRF